jgi:hypothetical protein
VYLVLLPHDAHDHLAYRDQLAHRDGHGVGLHLVGNVAFVRQHVADRHARRRLGHVDRSARGDRDANDHHDPH